ARFEIGKAAVLTMDGERASGVHLCGAHRPAGAVVVAAGPWTSETVRRPVPVAALWGVVVELELPGAPRHVLEEVGIEALTSQEGAPSALFSAVTARGISAVGSTFTRKRPDPEALAPGLLEHAERFVPGI